MEDRQKGYLVERTLDEQNKNKEEISLLDLVVVLIKKKWLIIVITTLSMIAILTYVIGSIALSPEKSYMPNVYKPKAIMLVSESGGGMSSMLGNSAGLAALAGINIAGGKSNGELAVFIAKSNTTLDELNKAFDFTTRFKIKKGAKTETRKAIQKSLTVAFDAKTGTLSIAFESIDPEFAQRVVNRTVEILDRRFASLGGNKALLQKELLETKIAGVQVQIKKLEADSKAFVTKYGVVNVEALATEQITILARLRSELIMKDMEIENYEKFSKIDDPVIRRLKSEKESIEAKLIQLEKGSGGLIPNQRQLPAIAFEYAAIQRDLAVQGEIFKLLTQQYEMAKLNADGQDPTFQVLELAEVPDMKSGPSRAMLCIVVTMAGFFFSVLCALVLNAIENIKKDPDAMKKLRGEE